MIAGLIGWGAYRSNANSVLRVCSYLQGGVLLLLGMVTHFMGMQAAAVCVIGAGACYYFGAAGVRRRGMFAAAAILFLAALAQMVAVVPDRVNTVFAFQQCGLAVGLVALAWVVGSTRRRGAVFRSGPGLVSAR